MIGIFFRFADRAVAEKTIEEVREMVSEFQTDIANESNVTRRSSATSLNSSISFFFDNDTELSEIDSYLSYKVISNENVELDVWWNEHRSIFPSLFKLSLFILAIPASSTPSERAFSMAGNIVTDKRCDLDPDSLENLVI